MWILHFLPDSLLEIVVNTILIVGIILTFISVAFINPVLRFFPSMSGYYRLIQIFSIFILISGVYFKGGYSTEMLWREKVAELESKLKIAEAESENVKVVVEKQVVTNTKFVKQRANNIIEYVDREIVKYDKSCIVPPDVVEVHNEAANMNKIIEQNAKAVKK